MAGVGRVPRSRGGVSGVLLMLLGAWGGLAPFVGPYIHYAFTPDKAWEYTSGRLWLSVVPGAAALIGGLLTASASRRAVGCLGALLAALGGAWLIVGAAVIKVTVTSGSISPGAPLSGPVGSLNSATRQFLEGLGFFTGTGVLILFFGALALGRLSVFAVKDAALAEDALPLPGSEVYPEPDPVTQDVTFPATTGQFPATTGQFPAASSQYAPGEQPRTAPEQFPTTTSPFRRPPPPDPGSLRGPG